MNNSHPNHPDNNFNSQTGEIDEAVTGEIIEPIGTGVLATIHRVEIDQQVATAKAYPRNVPKIKQELTALVTMDEDTADDCIYALPRGKKHIKGPSARFADALISFWGNARSGAFITQVDRENKFVEAIGSFQDVERNVIRQRRVRRPISDRDGRIYNADMINMTGNAACVIAERNAILNGIPKSFWGPAYDRAFALVAGTTQTLGEKIARAKKHFMAMEIDFVLVLQKIDRMDESKIVPEDIVTMRGMLTALRSGEETIETIFGRSASSNHEHVKNPLKDDPDETKVQRHAAASQNGNGTTPEQTKSSGYVPDQNGPISSGPMRSAAADKAPAEPAGEPAGEQVAKPEPAKNNAPAAAAAQDKPYSDAASYISFMHDQFDQAKVKASVTEIWGSTRGDRNELLSPEQIEGLTKDKEAKLLSFKVKG